MPRKPKEYAFVMLGIKRNGRIVKNEEYQINELLEGGYAKSIPSEISGKFDVKFSLFNLIFKKKKIEERINDIAHIGFAIGKNNGILWVKKRMENLILKDDFGKKKR